MTGSGKTGLTMVLVEEALRSRVPVLMIDGTPVDPAGWRAGAVNERRCIDRRLEVRCDMLLLSTLTRATARGLAVTALAAAAAVMLPSAVEAQSGREASLALGHPVPATLGRTYRVAGTRVAITVRFAAHRWLEVGGYDVASVIARPERGPAESVDLTLPGSPVGRLAGLRIELVDMGSEPNTVTLILRRWRIAHPNR